MKLCKDCKWYEKRRWWSLDPNPRRCMHDEASTTDPETGKVYHKTVWATRVYPCGQSGIFWEPK